MDTTYYYNKLVHIENELSQLDDSTNLDDDYINDAIGNIASDIGDVKEKIIHQEAKKYRKLKGISLKKMK